MRKKKIQSKSGVALLLVLMGLALMAILCIEISFTAYVDMRIGRNARDRLQAHYLARSAARLSFLRIFGYKELINLNIAKTIPDEMAKFADAVWSMPTPPLPLDASAQKDPWPGSFSVFIRSEGSKIPINLLDGDIHRKSSQEIAQQTKDQLIQVFQSFFEDDEFEKSYRNLAPEDFVNPLIDWIDKDSIRQDGGDENALYTRSDPSYGPRNDRIATIEELHFIRGWTDDIYEKVKSHISPYNTKLELNPKYISIERLQRFHPKFEVEDLKLLAEYRLTNEFGTLNDMQTYIQRNLPSGRDFQFPKQILDSEPKKYRETLFAVEAEGVVGETRQKIKMIVTIPQETSTDKEKEGKLKEPEALFVEEGA